MPSTPTTAFAPVPYPTSLTPRPDDRRQVRQREGTPINIALSNSEQQPEDGSANSGQHAIPRISGAPDASLIDGMEELGSPTSFHTAVDLVSPTFGSIPLGDPLSPVTPKTSTSMTSFTSDISSLVPLVTHQDIKDDEQRAGQHRVAQRRKLEHMLSDDVVVGIDAKSGEIEARCLAEPIGKESEIDDWQIIADNGNTSKSKLERTLGRGADSAHVALNADYRKRLTDSLDTGRSTQEGAEFSTTPPLKAIPASFESIREGPATSSGTIIGRNASMASSETSAKLISSISFTAVREAARKRLLSKDQESSASRRGRSSSPAGPDTPGFETKSGDIIIDNRLPVVDNLDPEERKILLNRTRKLERVLGETLKEQDIERHVVKVNAYKCASSDAEEGDTQHRTQVSLNVASQTSFGDGTVPEPSLSRLSAEMGSQMSPGAPAQVVEERNLRISGHSGLEANAKNVCTCAAFPSPRLDTKRVRRYSSPALSGNDSWHVSGAILDDWATSDLPLRGQASIEREKRRRRLQMIKLNRVLGARVPFELLGYAGNPALPACAVHDPVTERSNEATEAENIARKKRAVKVASKMYYMFGEPPPLDHYSGDVIPDSCAPATGKPSRRSTFRANVENYYQSIHSIRYLLENDRQSLDHVIGDIQEETVHVNELRNAPPAVGLVHLDNNLVSFPDHDIVDTQGLKRQRSLSLSCLPTGSSTDGRSTTIPNALPQVTDGFDFEPLTGLRRRAAKLNSFFGDPRIGSGVIGQQSKQYMIADKKVALEKLLLELEDNANFDAEQDDLEKGELSEIRLQLLSVRRSASLLIVAPGASNVDAS